MSQTKRATSHNRLLNYQPLLSEREFASSREWGEGAMSPTRCPKIILSRKTTFSANKSRGVRSGGSRKVSEGTWNNSSHFEFFSGRKCHTHTHTHTHTRDTRMVKCNDKEKARGGGILLFLPPPITPFSPSAPPCQARCEDDWERVRKLPHYVLQAVTPPIISPSQAVTPPIISPSQISTFRKENSSYNNPQFRIL